LYAQGLAYDKLIPKNERNSDKGHPAHPGFIVLYCLANFFQNFGPNVTTFILPGELFPTRYRSTSFGISAASGKFGAIISQIMFAKLVDRGGESAWVKNL
jgi:PHS family inorganic phosphate transporter-like MFS transporter